MLKEVARRISGAVAGEVYAKVNIPSTHHNPYLSHYIICHLPLVFLSPTSPFSFYSPSLSQSPPLFAVCLFLVAFLLALVLVCLFVAMALPRFGDLHLKRLEEIESNVRKFMVLQFEHNNFFRNKLKEQKKFYELYE